MQLWQLVDRMGHGDAIDGAVLVGRSQRLTCNLASLPPRPYHVCTPPPRVRTSKTGCRPH
eukprot:837888-Prymnesium_polylepis.1